MAREGGGGVGDLQDKTRQDKITQDKTKHGNKTRQDKIKKDKRHDKTRQDD